MHTISQARLHAHRVLPLLQHPFGFPAGLAGRTAAYHLAIQLARGRADACLLSDYQLPYSPTLVPVPRGAASLIALLRCSSCRSHGRKGPKSIGYLLRRTTRH